AVKGPAEPDDIREGGNVVVEGLAGISAITCGGERPQLVMDGRQEVSSSPAFRPRRHRGGGAQRACGRVYPLSPAEPQEKEGEQVSRCSCSLQRRFPRGPIT